MRLACFHTRADEIAFENTVEEFGLQDCVSWRTARLPYDELGDFVARHRIGLIPGQVSTNNLTPFVPTKLFEYLACGIPVVASALPSIVRLRALGEWGIIADPADPAAHAAAIVGLLDNPQEADRLGGCGRALVESVCNWEPEALKLLGLYEELLAGQVAVNGTIGEAAS
jgi:glycosyltransferase involved in cell wall biosynthesis